MSSYSLGRQAGRLQACSAPCSGPGRSRRQEQRGVWPAVTSIPPGVPGAGTAASLALRVDFLKFTNCQTQWLKCMIWWCLEYLLSMQPSPLITPREGPLTSAGYHLLAPLHHRPHAALWTHHVESRNMWSLCLVSSLSTSICSEASVSTLSSWEVAPRCVDHVC